MQFVPTQSSSSASSSLPLATSLPVAAVSIRQLRPARCLITLRHPQATIPSSLSPISIFSSLVRLHSDFVLEQLRQRGSNQSDKVASPHFSTCPRPVLCVVRGPPHRRCSNQAIVKISRLKQAACRTLRYRRRGLPQAENVGSTPCNPQPDPYSRFIPSSQHRLKIPV